jgi:hypothetical protein
MTSNGRRRSTPGTTSTGFSRPRTWCRGERVLHRHFFTATGVTDGDLLRGVRFSSGAHTQSIVMRSKSGTVRVIETYHRLDNSANTQHRLHRRRQRTGADAINPNCASSTRPSQ